MQDFITLSQKIRADFEKEYDTEDLAVNDRIMLDELSTAMAQLELLNMELNTLLQESPIDTRRVTEVNKAISVIRTDISKIQDDLRITRKTRKEKTESIPEFIHDLKTRAAKFLSERLSYIYCPSCNTLVATIWLLDYNSSSKFLLVCPTCNNDFIINASQLDQRTNNRERVVPYSVRRDSS